MTHEQMTFNLLKRIQYYTHHNQDRCASIEVGEVVIYNLLSEANTGSIAAQL